MAMFTEWRSPCAVAFYVTTIALNAAMLILSAIDASWTALVMLVCGALILNVFVTTGFAVAARVLRRNGRRAPRAKLLWTCALVILAIDEAWLATIDLHGC